MAWKLDDIDFESYGVYVSKSLGVLDVPRMVDTSINWLDENGKDYWQTTDIKYEEREIVLSCWLFASSYSSFKTKVAAFYSALLAEGERVLETPFGNEINVSLQKEVQLARKTSYISSVQVGVFNLRLTVSGDSQTKPITIYRPDGVARGVYNYKKDARLSQTLQGDDSISMEFEFNTVDVIGRDDYISWDGSKYIAIDFPEITKVSSNKYIYRCRFTHQFFMLKTIQFRILDVAETAWYATMSDVVDKIIENAERRFPGVFIKGTVEDTVYINHQFANQNCLDVLANIASAYELEYGYRTSEGQIEINVQTKVGIATGLTLEYGKSNQLYSINRTSTQRDLMCTHLYAYGAAKNIPPSYKGGGRTRLELPTMPLVHEFYGIVQEQTKVFDHIYPHRTGTVSGYTYTPSTDPENYPERAKYEIADSTMPFDLKEKDINGNTIYLINGTSAKIHFNSGDCAGFEFEILDYNHATKTFTIIPLKEANGLMYPNATIYPGACDEYVLIDINLPQSYIDTAEAELLEAATAWQDEYWQPKVTFKVELKPGYDPGPIYPGDTVTISDPDANFGTSTKRIIDLTKDLYLGNYSLTVADVITLSNRQKLNNKVDKLVKVVETIKLDDVNTQRRSEETPAEVENKILNPIDRRLRANEIIRSESIDPRMLAYDAGIPQFYVSGAMLTENVDGDEDKIHISDGTISITNWRLATKQREEIVAGYNPTRTWNIPATSITLATKALYFIYAKCDLTEGSTACTIEVDTAHIEVKRDAGYLYYKLGFISEGEL